MVAYQEDDAGGTAEAQSDLTGWGLALLEGRDPEADTAELDLKRIR